MADRLPQGERLDHALTAAGISRSALSRRLAARDDVKAQAASLYRSIKKWIAGDPISPEYQLILETELELPAGYLYEPNVTAIRQREFEQRLAAVEAVVAELRAAFLEVRGDLSSGR